MQLMHIFLCHALFFICWMIHSKDRDREGYDMQQRPLTKTQCNYIVFHLPSRLPGSLLFLMKRVLTLNFHPSIIYSCLSYAGALEAGTYPSSTRTGRQPIIGLTRRNSHSYSSHQHLRAILSLCTVEEMTLKSNYAVTSRAWI